MGRAWRSEPCRRTPRRVHGRRYRGRIAHLARSAGDRSSPPASALTQRGRRTPSGRASHARPRRAPPRGRAGCRVCPRSPRRAPRSGLHGSRARLRRLAVRGRPDQPNALGAALLVDLGAHDVPALAQMKNTVVRLDRPALRCDADALGFPQTGSQSTEGRRPTKALTNASPPKPIASTIPTSRSGALKPYRAELSATTQPPTRRPNARPQSQRRGIQVERPERQKWSKKFGISKPRPKAPHGTKISAATGSTRRAPPSAAPIGVMALGYPDKSEKFDASRFSARRRWQDSMVHLGGW